MTQRGNAFAESFIAFIEGMEMERSPGDMPVIAEFRDVFEEVLRLSTVREIEFLYRALARDSTYTHVSL